MREAVQRLKGPSIHLTFATKLYRVSVILDQARLLLEQGRPKDAEIRIKEFLQQEPDNHYAISLLARCMYHRKQFNEGLQLMTEAIRLQPEESFYYYLRGFGFYQQDKPVPAIETCNVRWCSIPGMRSIMGSYHLCGWEKRSSMRLC